MNFQNIVDHATNNKYNVIFIGIGSASQRTTKLEEYCDDINQLYPWFMQKMYKNNSKLIIHFDPAFDTNSQKEFNDMYFMSKGFNRGMTPEAIEYNTWVSNNCNVIIVPSALTEDERNKFLESISMSVLISTGKVIAQEFTGRELLPSFKKFLVDRDFPHQVKRRLRNNVVWDITQGEECHCHTPMTKYEPILKHNGGFFNFIAYSNDKLLKWINTSSAIDKLLYKHFYREFRKIIDTHHVNYRRKLLNDKLLTSTPYYNEETPAFKIMDFIINEGDPMIRVLFKISSKSQEFKDKFTYKFVNYKQYDTYKWYSDMITELKDEKFM